MAVRVVFSADSFGVKSFSAKGHTDFSEKGKDIVCAAVSGVIQTLHTGAETVISEQGFIINYDDGLFEIICSENLTAEKRQAFDLLARSVLETLRVIESQYPGSCTIHEKAGFEEMLFKAVKDKR